METGKDITLPYHPQAFGKIFIVGAGAIGKTLAVLLKCEGHDVVLLRASRDDEKLHTETIQLVRNDLTITEAELRIESLSGIEHLDGLIVLTSKAFGNERLATLLKEKTNDSPVVILQNGLGVEAPFIDNGFDHVYRCVLFVTSQHNTSGQVVFKPVATCPIGIVRGDLNTLRCIVDTLDTPEFSFSVSENIDVIIWKKAIANCVFNSVCPLLETDNGIFHRSELALSIARDIIEECVPIANAKGISLTSDQIIESLLSISKASHGQFISTLQDIRKGTETEIRSLNYEVARIADLLGKTDSVRRTRLLGELTYLKSTLR